MAKDYRRLSDEIQRAVFVRDAYTCKACKRVLPCILDVEMKMFQYSSDVLVVDHVDGRSNDMSNLQTLCWKCNSAKAGKSDYSFKLSAALRNLGRCVTYYPSLARVIGIKESIFLCQILYWAPRGRHSKGPGWIYKSVEEVEEETGLSYREQKRLRNSLIKQNLLEENYSRTEHRLFFRINTEALDCLGFQMSSDHMTKSNMPHLTESTRPSDGTSAGNLPKVVSYKEHKITHETTHKPICEKCKGTGSRKIRVDATIYCECLTGESLRRSEKHLHFATAAGA